LILLGEESGSQQIIATFSNEVVEEVILLYSLERLVDLGKQLLFYC
jgi:hypothetical protein